MGQEEVVNVKRTVLHSPCLWKYNQTISKVGLPTKNNKGCGHVLRLSIETNKWKPAPFPKPVITFAKVQTRKISRRLLPFLQEKNIGMHFFHICSNVNLIYQQRQPSKVYCYWKYGIKCNHHNLLICAVATAVLLSIKRDSTCNM